MTGAPALPDSALRDCIRDRVDQEARAWSRETLGFDLAWGLDFFVRFYHEPLGRLLSLSEADALECASGTGLNAIAFVLAGGRSIRGYDKTPERVRVANEIAARLGLGDRAQFHLGDIHQLPAERRTVAFSLQTLEHVPRPLEALRALGDRAERALVLSTPNRWFPRDGHDTGLMFAHWLPPRARKRYAELRGAPTHQLCRFLSPREIDSTLPDFRLATTAYNFNTLEEWLSRFPCFFPYGKGGGRWLGPRLDSGRWRAAAMAFALGGAPIRRLSPMSEGIYLRR